MKRALLGLSALLIVLSPAYVRAQVLGRPMPEFEWSEDANRNGKKKNYNFAEQFRGRVCLVYFWRTSSLECVDGLKTLSDLKKKYDKKGLRIVSFCGDGKERFEKVSKDKDVESVFVSKMVFWGPAVLDIQEYIFGSSAQPEVVLIDPRGVIAWRGGLRDGVEDAVKDLIERTRPAAGDEQELRRRFSLAEKYESQGEFGKAYTVADDLRKVTDGDSSMQGKASGMMDHLAEAASKWLKEAVDAEKADNIEKAVRIVAEVSVRFGVKDDEGKTRDVAKDADNEIGRMNGDRKLKEPIRDALNNAKGQVMVDRAADLEQQGWYEDAVETYTKVTEDYKDTKAAKSAKEAVDRIHNDKTTQAKIGEQRDEESARRWLDIGKRYAAAQLYPQAREQFERILKDAPKTSVVPKAKEALGKLPKEAAASTDKSTDGKP